MPEKPWLAVLLAGMSAGEWPGDGLPQNKAHILGVGVFGMLPASDELSGSADWSLSLPSGDA